MNYKKIKRMVVNMKFEGSYVALITPFKSNGEVDEDKVRELVNYHIENGTAGIVPIGKLSH